MEQEKRAWLYCRIDAPEDTHGMLKSQKKELYDYAEQMGFTVIGCSEDLGSGLDKSRPGLTEVEHAVEQGKMDVLLVKKLSRLGKGPLKMLEFFGEMEQSGIKLYSPLEGEIKLFRDNNIIHGLTMDM